MLAFRIGRWLPCLGVASLLGVGAQAAAAPPEPRMAGEEIVFLLQYIGADYGASVRDGRILDPYEYREMDDFAGSVLERSGSTPGLSPDTVRGARQLQNAIRGLSDWPEIRGIAAGLVTRISEELALPAQPPGAPDLERGAALYASDCAPCHGPTGAGDGRATGLDPRPRPFRDEWMDLVSPYQVYNASRFGVAGTAMPSYEGARSDQELWDVAFHVLTLRKGVDPENPDPGVPVNLLDVARLSDRELLARLRSKRPDLDVAAVGYYRLHPPPFDPRTLAASARQPVASAEVAPETSDLGPDLETAMRLENTFARIAEATDPSLVGVATYAEADAAPEGSRGPHWREQAAADQRFPGYRRIGGGTGFFVTDDGYILTCHHLLVDPATGELAALVAVELPSHAIERARIVGVEPTVNVAVLKIEVSEPTPPVEIGDPRAVRVGHWVIAAGNPPGSERSFVTGTIAAQPARDCYQAERLATLFQTSFLVSPTTYGGPLLDIRGRTIGICSPRDDGRGITGASFAPAFGLPIDLAMTLFEPLRLRESRQSPWLGIAVLPLSREIRRRLPETPLTGIYIDDVFEPSPASAVGIQVGDILTRIDDIRMLAVQDFQKTLYLKGIDSEVELSIYRDGSESTHRVFIRQRPAEATPR